MWWPRGARARRARTRATNLASIFAMCTARSLAKVLCPPLALSCLLTLFPRFLECSCMLLERLAPKPSSHGSQAQTTMASKRDGWSIARTLETPPALGANRVMRQSRCRDCACRVRR